jgi:PKHD-type hydroxylase
MTRSIDVYTPPMIPFIGWQAFSPEECDQIKKIGEMFEFQNAKMGSGSQSVEDKEYRDTDITWIEPNEKTYWIFDRMNEVLAYINFHHFQLDLVRFDGFQYSKYKEGGHYKRHVDTITNPPHGLFRKLSMSILLSDPEDYEGGELVIDVSGNMENAMRAKPGKGECVFFYSHLPHMVEPVTSGKRIALVTWALGEKQR